MNKRKAAVYALEIGSAIGAGFGFAQTLEAEEAYYAACQAPAVIQTDLDCAGPYDEVAEAKRERDALLLATLGSAAISIRCFAWTLHEARVEDELEAILTR